jgi:hypothetical protein
MKNYGLWIYLKLISEDDVLTPRIMFPTLDLALKTL